jgi:hypothetical protein
MPHFDKRDTDIRERAPRRTAPTHFAGPLSTGGCGGATARAQKDQRRASALVHLVTPPAVCRTDARIAHTFNHLGHHLRFVAEKRAAMTSA